MKATLVAIFFLGAVTYCTGRLSEEQCRAPVPETSCSSNADLRTVYSFDGNTNRCMRRQSCGVGVNQFEKKDCCESECPYGEKS
uniref:Putative salivary kunitz domain protein n=1 Tax=Ixodes ricinus TaxID=34613 RepID=A0A0K8REA1_IXORI